MFDEEPKYKKLFNTLRSDILSGKYAVDRPLPSFRALMQRQGLSISTVRHAFDELAREGLVVRIRGAGTYVSKQAVSRKIGLILPGVAYSDYFLPIVSEISRQAQEHGYMLIFGTVKSSDPKARAKMAVRFARKLVKECVAGVIYHPLELFPGAEKMNQDIVSVFAAAKIPVVLIDSDISFPPVRSAYDVVGINDVEAGYQLASHLLERGARRIHFLMRPYWAVGCHKRMYGAMAAVQCRGDEYVFKKLVAEPDDLVAIRHSLKDGKPDAFICGNDESAAKFKQTLEKLGCRVPEDMLLAAFGDTPVARLTTPPLTVIHHPCEEIGAKVFETLISRIAHPESPVGDIFLSTKLVVRESTMCGIRSEQSLPERKKQSQDNTSSTRSKR